MPLFSHWYVIAAQRLVLVGKKERILCAISCSVMIIGSPFAPEIPTQGTANLKMIHEGYFERHYE